MGRQQGQPHAISTVAGTGLQAVRRGPPLGSGGL